MTDGTYSLGASQGLLRKASACPSESAVDSWGAECIRFSVNDAAFGVSAMMSNTNGSAPEACSTV